MRVTLSLLAVAVSACTLSPAAPVKVTTPAVAVDVDAERTKLEDAVCADAASPACAVLGELDRSDDGIASEPPRLPLVMPQNVLSQGNSVLVAKWIERQRKTHDLVPQLSVPVDLGEWQQAAEELRHATIVDAHLSFSEDTLSMDLPALRIGVDEVGDGKNVEDVGVIAAHAGGSGEEAQLSLRSGGAQRLLNAIAAGSVDVVVRADDGAPIGLLAGPDGTIERPGGAAQVSLSVQLDITSTVKANVTVEGPLGK